MKKLIALLFVCVSCSTATHLTETVSYEKADVIVTRGFQEIRYRNVRVMDAQEGFVMFLENGVGRIEKEPYRIVVLEK